MIETYNLIKLPYDSQNTYVCGDSHGAFELIKYKIKQNDIIDSAIIIAGDCGFGFEKEKYYVDTVYNNLLKKELSERNITLIFLRGNHDDPEYFNGEKRIDFQHFKTIPDYSVINLTDGSNILCVGGATSIDRMRSVREELNAKEKGNFDIKLYWENEWPEYIPEVIDKIKSDGINITNVISHTSPHFAPLTDKHFVKNFAIHDKTLLEDLDKERMIVTNIYNHLIKKCNYNIETWFYGHFHEHKIYHSNEGIKFILLDCMDTRNAVWDIAKVKNC